VPRPAPRLAAVLAAVLAVVAAGCSAGATSGQPSASPPAPTPPTSSALAQPAPSPSTGASSPASSPASSAPVRHRHRPRRSPAPTSTHPAPPPSSPSAPDVNFPPGAGPVVVLNPGHDGGNASHPDEINRQVPAGFGAHKACDTAGTTTNGGYPEHAYTWDLALRTRRILRAHGVRVVLARSSDTGVGPCVDQRAAIGNHPQVAAVVNIHGDGGPASGHGFFVMTASRRPDGASDEVVRQNQQLAVAVHDGLARDSGMTTASYIGTNGYLRTDQFAGLNLSTRPAVFLEIGNMRNAGDAALQSSPSGRAGIAAGLAAGILDYLRSA
jgi:N-acetylmuramoyl-L-alanine amidase